MQTLRLVQDQLVPQHAYQAIPGSRMYSLASNWFLSNTYAKGDARYDEPGRTFFDV
jgi:hypothetical protein